MKIFKYKSFLIFKWFHSKPVKFEWSKPQMQGLVKGAILCFRNPNFYFWHGESTSTASQKSKDLTLQEGASEIDIE